MAAGIISLLLAGMLCIAGAAKLLDPGGTNASLRDFAVPGRLAEPFALLLPLTELAIAIALLVPVTAPAGAAAALALFALFTVVIAASLARGRRPDCGCFGKLHSRPIGASTLARTMALAALAAALLAFGPAGVAAGAVDVRVWLGIAVIAQAVFIVVLLRRHAEVLARAGEAAPASLAHGAEAPAFALPDVTTDELVSLGDLLSQGRPAALLFTDPGCAPCSELLPEVRSWQESGRPLAVVGVGGAELNRATAAEHGLSHLLLQEAREVADAYGVAGTPAAVVVDGDGRVAQPAVYGAAAVRDVIASLEPARRPTRGAVGAVAAVGAALVPAAGAAIADDASAYREIKRIIRATSPKIIAREKRFATTVNGLMAAADKRAATFNVLGEIALLKKELRRAYEQLDEVVTPDYRRGEKNPSRIAKSDAVGVLRLLEVALDRFVTTLNAKQERRRVALYDETAKILLDAEYRRRALARRLGCTKALADC